MTEKKKHPAAFKPGQSGNPAGKPKGAKNHATRALLHLMEGSAEQIAKAVLTAAKGGDMAAAKFVLERIVPAAKERPLSLHLPPIESPTDIATAQSAILQAVAAGEITPSEGTTLAGIVEARRKALETDELAQRLAELEARMEGGTNGHA